MASWLRQYCIWVTDIEETIKFYETIGLECTARTEITADVKEAMIENPERGAWIQLAQNTKQEGPIHMGTSTWKLYVYTDDIQGIYDAAMAAGYKSVSEPAKAQRWPTTIAFIEDPDGYQVELVQRDEPAQVGGAGGSPRDQF
jgi:catechol 2,3-dioxygenase-like lactoylglutathione lyase family enzyme